MPRIVRFVIGAAFCLAVIAGFGLWAAYRAASQVMPFYEEALLAKPENIEQASREMETQAGALYSDAQASGAWSGVFTQEQLNAWLAVQLSQAGSRLLPQTIRDPRVAISPDRLQLGFRSDQAGIETVISVDANVMLTEEGELAIRLKAVRAGALPLPMGQIAEEMRTTSSGWALPVRWTQVQGDVVALVDLAEVLSNDDHRVQIQALELHDGEVYISGETLAPDGTLLTEGPFEIDASELIPLREAAVDQAGSQSSLQ